MKSFHILLRLSTLFSFLLIGINFADAAIYFSRSSGNWNSTSTWSTTGYAGAAAGSTPGAAAGDIVLISGYTVSVTATPAFAVLSIVLSQNNNSGNDTKLNIGTAGVTLTCNSLSMVDNALNNHMDVNVYSTARLQVNGSVSATRGASNNRDTRMCFSVTEDGRMNVTGSFTYTFNRARNNEATSKEITLSDNGRLDINGNFTATLGNTSGDDNKFEFQMNDNSICNILGNVSMNISNTDDGDDMEMDLNGGVLTISGDFLATVYNTATTSNSFTLDIDGATMITDNLTYDQSGGGNGDMNLRLNRNSTASPASLTVNGNLTFLHNSGDNMELETNGGATVNITNTFDVTISLSADGDVVYVDLNGGVVNSNSMTTTLTAGATSSNFLYLTIDGATLNVTNDLTLTQEGGGGTGDLDIFLNQSSTAAAALLNVGGDFNVKHTGGDNYEVELNDNSAFTIAGNMIDTLVSNDGDDFVIDINGGIFTVGQNFYHIQTSSGGTAEDLNVRIDGSGKFNINGSLLVNHQVGGEIIFYLNNSNGTTAELNVGGDFIIDHGTAGGSMYLLVNQTSKLIVGGNFTINNYASGGDIGRVQINQTGTFYVGGNLTMNLLSGLAAVSDRVQLDINGGSLQVGGNLTLNATAGENAYITLDNTCSLIVSDSILLTNSGGNIVYIYVGNGAGSPSLAASVIILSNTGGAGTRLRAWNSSTVTTSGDIIMTALASSKIDMAMYNTSHLYIGGNFQRDASPNRFGILSCATGSTVEYNGSSLQTLAGNTGSGSDNFTYGKMILNNPAGFTLPASEGTLTIPAGCDLSFTNGVVTTTSSSYIIIANTATVSGACDASHVSGPIRKIGNQAFTFPIGKNGNYQPASISAPSNSTHHFTAEYFAADPRAVFGTNRDVTLNHLSGCEYWNINRTNGGSNVTVTLSWDGASCGVDDMANLKVARWDGTTWKDHGNGGTTGSNATGTITNSATVTAYLSPNSPFTLTSANTNNPLPIELISFDVIADQKNVNLKWTTANETDNDYFSVERSNDGKRFFELIKLKGAGNSNDIKNYGWVDNAPLMGRSYYRLKQVDTDGAFSYSQTKNVNFKKGEESQNLFTVFPNPSNGNMLNIALKNGFETESENLQIELFDMNGVMVCSMEKFYDNKLNSTLLLNFENKLKQGVYVISISSKQISQKQLIVIS